ncbi:hypothetical protein [Streptomyces sp. NPDC059761]|uniref:hypothetical protein n=1 Tax=Streptomyces sp. NPDC059761 TaxID=3346937 RepID=UPI00366182D0
MNIPILGQSQPDRFDREYGTVHQRSELAQGDLHDSEIVVFEHTLATLMDRYKDRAFNLDEFEREAKERFHDLGFAIEVTWAPFTINGKLAEGALAPGITLIGRVDRTTFDHDQKVHEITHNVLELDQAPGVIKSSAARGGHPH